MHAALVVIDPSGRRSRVEIEPLPFRIGRHADCNLILRDSRASRNHAQIVLDNGDYVLEDAGSRSGVYINGERVSRRALRNSDRIEFGFADSYQLIFAIDAAGALSRAMESAATTVHGAGAGANLGKLRAVLEVARALESSFSMDEVLATVVNAALAVTGAERGFLLLQHGEELEVRIARDREGRRLAETELRVPRRVIRRALENRRELLSMNFDPHAADAGASIVELELRSVVCVPLLRINAGLSEATSMVSMAAETVGALYMDSRAGSADLTGGNRELLQSLAIEASTILENARLLEEERAKQKMEEELKLAREIQQSLLPPALPSEGWFRACGTSVACHEVGGDYFDVVRVTEDSWTAVVADVSGKGVGSALLASYLQGAFLALVDASDQMQERMRRINRRLVDRAGGEKYATVFWAMLHRNGVVRYINAGHCSPLVVSADGCVRLLSASATPVGLLEDADFEMAETRLVSGDKIVIYTDGVTEAQNAAGEFFGKQRLRELASASGASGCGSLHDALSAAVASFAGTAVQSDDITLLVVEFA